MSGEPPRPMGATQHPKVAIPRLDPASLSSVGRRDDAPKDSRVARACIGCRKRKTKCSGDTPRCTNCATNNIECVYDQARRDRLRIATNQNQKLVALLEDLRLRVDDEDKRKIYDALESMEGDTGLGTATSNKALGKRSRIREGSDSERQNIAGEANAPASVGSNEDLDLLDEDLHRSRESRVTGYIGQGSEVQWLRSLQRNMDTSEGEPIGLPYGPPGGSVSAFSRRSEALNFRRRKWVAAPMRPVTESTFYLDAESIELDDMVDPHEVPAASIAEKLFDCFMKTVCQSFPIIPSEFEDQLKNFYDAAASKPASPVHDKWLVSLNLIFAIGARYSHLVDAKWRGHDRDHVVYMTRAVRLLGLTESVFSLAPDLTLIQSTGLLSFYYLAVGHVSRAWVVIGVAIRFALSLGLHLRNEDPTVPESAKATCVRTWWSLHSLECLLSAITGRPSVLAAEDCTVRLPHVLAQEQTRQDSTAGPAGSAPPPPWSFFASASEFRSPEDSSSMGGIDQPERTLRLYQDAHLSIGVITQKALFNLFAPRVTVRSWEYIQKSITGLLEDLEAWKQEALPDKSDRPINRYPSSGGPREAILLWFSYHSTRILITRPCLCRTERHITNQTKGSANFNQKMAQTCVQSAQEVIRLLPNEPDPQNLYANGPWWCIGHNLMQAMAVLLLELSYQSEHMSAQSSDISACVKKSIRWLQSMQHNDNVIDKAYKVVVSIMRNSRRKFPIDLDELFVDANVAAGPGQRGQRPAPAECASNWNSNWWPGQSDFDLDVCEQTNIDPTLLADGGPTSPFQADPYLFNLPQSVINPSMYFNPFSTSFDQEAPILVSTEDLWPSISIPNFPDQ